MKIWKLENVRMSRIMAEKKMVYNIRSVIVDSPFLFQVKTKKAAR